MVGVVQLAPLDLAIIGLFVAALFGLGLSARLRSHDAVGFIAAGRQLTLPMFVATLVCTWYGGILGMGESVSYFGIGTWLLLGLPYYVFAGIYVWRLAGRVRESDQISIPERLRLRYGNGVARAGAGLLFALGAPSAHVVMLGTLVQVLTGWAWPISLAVGLLFGLSFLMKGGLLADVRVSVLSFVAMYLGFGAILVYCLTQMPWGEAVAKLPSPEMQTFTGGQGPISILSFFLLGAWTLIDPGFHQRVASAGSVEVARRGLIVSIFCWMVFDLLSIGTGVYAVAMLTEMPANPVAIFPVFGGQILPDGLKALFLCGMTGTIVSALVGYALISGSTLGRDLWSDGRDDPQTMTRVRIGIAVGGLTAYLLGLAIPSVKDLWYSWGGLTVGSLLVPTLLAYDRLWKTRLTSGWMLASLLAGAVVGGGLLAYGVSIGNPFLMVTWVGQSFSIGTLVPSLAASLLVVALGEGIARVRNSSLVN